MNRFNLIAGAFSDKGKFKDTNEDNILVKIGEDKSGDFGMFVVCDGLGGLEFGEIASNIAVMKLKKWWEEELAKIIKTKIQNEIPIILSSVLKKINETIIEYGIQRNKKLGTTMSLIFIYGGKYYILHVGDSRIYSVKNGIERLTEDHSYVAYKVKNKMMTQEQARVSPDRHILMQCIGVKREIDIFKKTGILNENEIFIICSDGFYNKLKDEDIKSNILNYDFDDETLQKAAKKLVQIVRSRGETDNISVILVGAKKNKIL
ncbi:PP2C family protein-serine/threonine phosphatase [Clostridium hydrogenum]|uniref:PP2C family protein-serine/threonine phosphatase n=1 Tax=Clostridium hydrogenum TaxID=2855764 RepID=UPI001F3F8B37|nr:PP2C family serine/threonine-protein phosphatase [Clostridium hydrogenum]